MTFPGLTDYSREQTELIRSATLTVATVLGDYMDDLVIVGGLVPSLLIPPTTLPVGTDAHVGTMDLDLGLDLAILDNQRYAGIAKRLSEAGFSQDINEKGNKSRQCWRFDALPGVKVEFLIPPVNEDATPGRLQNLENELAAFIIPGLELAFQDKIIVELDCKTLLGETTSRAIPVCNPGVFVMLKTLAFHNRGKFKDAYDLYYMVRNYGKGPEDVASFFKPLLDTGTGQEAVDILRTNFLEEKAPGPIRVARFVTGMENAELQADVVGFIADLLRTCDRYV